MKRYAVLCVVAVVCTGVYAAPVTTVKSDTDGGWDQWTVYINTELVPDGYGILGLAGQFRALEGGTFMCNGTLYSTRRSRTTNSVYGLYPHQFTMNFVSVQDFTASGNTPSVIDGYWDSWDQDAYLRAIEPDPNYDPLPRNILCVFWITAGKSFEFDGFMNRAQFGVPGCVSIPLSFTPEPTSLSLLSLGGLLMCRGVRPKKAKQ